MPRNKMWKTEIMKAFPPLFLLIDSITWFSLIWFTIQDLLEKHFIKNLLVSLSFYVAFMFSAWVGATLMHEKLRKKTFLLSWVIFGTCFCLISIFLVTEKILFNLSVMAFLFGISSGLGIPTCLAFFADYTIIGNRGRIGAIVFFTIQLLTATIYFSIGKLSIGHKFLALAIWRLLGVVSIPFVRFERKIFYEGVTHRLVYIVREKPFVLYFVPWLLLSLVNFVEAPLLKRFFGYEVFFMYTLIEIIIISISAFLGGVLCDLKGRRTTSILGFVMLGTGYAALSLFSGMQFSQILYVLLDGMAWGLLHVTFIFVIWGDLSERRVREKYYFLGGMPFLLSGLIEVLVQPFVEIIPIYASFSLASFFLFLAVLPLLYAPETLPERNFSERELRQYIEKAKRIKEKFSKD